MTTIALNGTYTDVRGGGYGRSAWIARITGLDSKYGLSREFCKRDASDMSKSGKSGILSFDVTEPGYYEFRDFCVGSTARNWRWSGMVRIDEDGTVTDVSRDEVLRAMAEAA